ncbi:MAG: DUF502 domain-containing protein [Chlamydiia bacterium]|nr:DUF502 domain-containing protein [Chlamydiia bacterium]
MKKYFLTGLVTLLPLAVTFWIVVFLIDFLTKPFTGLVVSFFTSFSTFAIHVPEQAARTISQIVILISLFFFTLFLGFVARRFFFNQLLHLGDRFLYKIPLVNKIYKTSKDIVRSLFGTKKTSFKQVVLLPFPYKKAYCIGLISTESPTTCSAAVGNPMLSVFIPTTPNPMTGYLVMCRKEDLIFLSMKSEEAFKYIVSCGVIQPQQVEKRGAL